MKAPVRPSGAYRISEAGSAGDTKAEPAPEPPELDGWRYGKRVNAWKKRKNLCLFNIAVEKSTIFKR
jgi:hypothetical protein